MFKTDNIKNDTKVMTNVKKSILANGKFFWGKSTQQNWLKLNFHQRLLSFFSFTTFFRQNKLSKIEHIQHNFILDETTQELLQDCVKDDADLLKLWKSVRHAFLNFPYLVGYWGQFNIFFWNKTSLIRDSLTRKSHINLTKKMSSIFFLFIEKQKSLEIFREMKDNFEISNTQTE